MSNTRRSSSGFAPAPGNAAFKDILKFEQRLLQNAENLAKQRRKYQAFLAALVLSIAVLAYRVFVAPSIYTLVHYSYSGLLLIATTTLVLFFASGMYSEKIVRAYKFVPQANRSLRPLNMHLNTKTSATFSWFVRDKPVRRDSTRSGSRSPQEKQDRTTSPSARHTIPPSTNAKGELIFSNRVDPAFKDGYANYRAEWERRRKDRPTSLSRRGSQRRAASRGSEKEASLQGSTDSVRDTPFPSHSPSPPLSRSPSPASRSPSPEVPDLAHSNNPSSGTNTSGPPSPRSITSTEDPTSNSYPLPKQDHFDGSGYFKSQVRVRS